MSICDKFFFTKRGNITKVFKDNYKLFRDYELNCLLSDNRKFLLNLIFPNFLGKTFNEIIDNICYFIHNKDNLYYRIKKNSFEDNLKYNKITLLKEKKFKYFIIYLNILEDINITEIINKNFGDLIENDNVEVIKYEFINNDLNYCKNSLRHLIYNNISKVYKNTLFKNKEINNFKELYNIIENSKQFKNNIKKIDKIAKILKKTIDTEIKNNLKIIKKEKYEEIILENLKKKFKKIPNNISFYLQYLPEYFNKSYVKKELVKKLKENKIKYKL